MAWRFAPRRYSGGQRGRVLRPSPDRRRKDGLAGETTIPALAGERARAAMPKVRRQLWLLRWGSILGPAFLLGLFAVASWDRHLHTARDEALRRSELIGEYMSRTIDGQATLLAAGERAHDLLARDPQSDLRLHGFLAGLASEAGDGGIGLVAPDGRLMVSSTRYPATGNYSDRAYLRATPADGLYVDRVRLRGGSGDEALIVARRDHGAPSAGVWVAQIEAKQIEDFLRALAPEDSGDSASVWREDGQVLLRNIPMSEPVRLAQDSVAMQAIAGGKRRADYETASFVDGKRRIYSTRRLGDAPLYVSFGLAVDRLRAVWLRQILVAGALLGACGAVAFGLARQAGRGIEAEARRAAHDFDRKLLAEAQKTAAARETMLKELNHRINNNLQMIQSLIRLQKSRHTGPDLDEISARILAIARIHDLLYQSGSAFSVDLAALLRSVATNSALVPPERNILVLCDLEEVEVDARLATPIALSVTELVTNAVKHAFDAAGGQIWVGLRRVGEEVEVTVSDDGKGFETQNSGRRSGSRLIEALAAQIGGRLEIGPLKPEAQRCGSRVAIVFPLERAPL